MLSTKEIVKILKDPINLSYLLIVSFLLGLLIAQVYKKNTRSVSYSQSFVTTLVLLLPVISIIILFISNNIASAIGVFGAFSVVRFRTAIKDSKDMFFIFWVLATGVIVGLGEMVSAAFATVAISIMVYFLNSTNFGKFLDYDYLLVYILDSSKADITNVNNSLANFTKKVDLLNVQSSKDGKELEVTASLNLKKGADLNNIISHLKENKAIKSLSINPAKFDLEY